MFKVTKSFLRSGSSTLLKAFKTASLLIIISFKQTDYTPKGFLFEFPKEVEMAK